MTIEQEIRKATKIRPGKDRQEYLKSVVKKLGELTDDQYRELSQEAQDWGVDATNAFNSKQEIPDFDNGDSGDAVDAEQHEEARGRKKAADKPKSAKKAAPKKAAPKAAKKAADKPKSAKKAADKPKAAKKAAPKAANGAKRDGSKSAWIVERARSKKGVSTAEVLEHTGWPAVSMPAMLRGHDFRKEGRPARYYIDG